MPTHVLELGRPTLATLESTAFLALDFGAVNGQDFRTRRDPLGRFTLFLISPLVSSPTCLWWKCGKPKTYACVLRVPYTSTLSEYEGYPKRAVVTTSN